MYLEIRRVSMLSIAVKNALLVVVLVLIFHFMIKTHLLENKPRQQFTNPVFPEEECPPLSQPKLDPLPPSTLPPKVDKEAELFKFVFDDPPQEACKPPMEVKYIPESGTVKAPRPPSQTSINHDNPFISEYDNESSMNGGVLFGSLSGFDSMAADYVSI